MSLNTNTFGEYLFGDLLPVPILTVTEDRYLPQIQQFVAAENAFVDAITGILCDEGTEVQSGMMNGVGGRMQKMAKQGSVEATRAGQRWFCGYPLFAFGNKQIYEVPWLDRATFRDLAVSILNATLQDVETTIVEMENAILNNVNSTFDDSQWPGMNAQNVGAAPAPVTVARLANADGSVGSVYANGMETPLASLNHYLTSGASSIAVGAFTMARSALRNVGNDKDVVYVVSHATADTVQDTFSSTDFVEPVEVRDANFIDPVGKYAVGSTYGIADPGIRTRGRVKFGELVEWPHWPDNYIFAYDRTKAPPLRRRISDLAKYQGLQLAGDDDLPDVQTHPLARKQWRRIQGFAARNRVNGVVVQITTSGSYTAPTL